MWEIRELRKLKELSISPFFFFCVQFKQVLHVLEESVIILEGIVVVEGKFECFAIIGDEIGRGKLFHRLLL